MAIPLFWHPQPGRLEPCLSSRITGGSVITNCVEKSTTPIESESIYRGCCADCSRLLAKGKVPTHYKDMEVSEKRAGHCDNTNRNSRRRARSPKFCVIL
ncbi:hypothetical protein VM1G_11458 [Cytospora mali]|uniref:Uncharacterized protein n=1 Tax=Cytospora mali TaxID=578113 RepID=A0A194VTQ3_CYTMA|nr:hypothetical protein VM1G_11458 [Valsa mali]